MINGKLEFCRDDFKMYRTLEAQLAFYQKQMSELRDDYLIVDTVNDYRSGQAHTVTIETVQQTAYARSKAQVEAVILDLTQKLWIIRRTVDLATGCTEAALQGSGCNVRLSRNGTGQNSTPPVRFAPDCQQVY